MPRIARKDINTNYFHIMVQGINKEYIFNKDEYIEEYLKIICIFSSEYAIEILSYCIMNNHAHLLIYSKDTKELYKFMHKINMVYAIYYNKCEKRTGYVFRDRYNCQGIYKQKHLLNCMLYIHMNPIKAKIVNNPSEYKYSSFNEYLFQKNIITSAGIKLIFGNFDYKEQFKYMHTQDIYCDEFLDVEDKDDLIKEIIEKYKIKNNISLEEIIQNKEVLKEIVIKLKQMKISNRKIEKVIEISRETIRKLSKCQ